MIPASVKPGERVGTVTAEEAEHFFLCRCGQAVDMRDLAEVFRHEEDGHEPRKLDA